MRVMLVVGGEKAPEHVCLNGGLKVDLGKTYYSRSEYREKYLSSDDWAEKRKLVMVPGARCVRCSRRATDAHHLRYKNLVDVTSRDLVPLCRDCHKYVHSAIKAGIIGKQHTIHDIRGTKEEKLSDAKRVVIGDELISKMVCFHPDAYKLISGIIRMVNTGFAEDFRGRVVNGRQYGAIAAIVERFRGYRPFSLIPDKKAKKHKRSRPGQGRKARAAARRMASGSELCVGRGRGGNPACARRGRRGVEAPRL